MLNNKIKIFLLFSLVLITIGGLSVLSATDADHQTTDHSSKIVKDTTKHVDIQKITKTKVNNKNTQTNKKIKTNNKTEDKEITTKKTDNTQSSDNKITKKTDKEILTITSIIAYFLVCLKCPAALDRKSTRLNSSHAR